MASTAPVERETHLLDVGKQCSHSLCHTVDFLPFKCHHCELSFCQEHYKVEDHKCPKYDESKHNRVAPNCPLCNVPIAIPPGQDPNIRMEQHFDKECSVMTGRLQSKSTPRCGRGTCNKVLFSPIRCDNCRKQFCPAHRFPADHSCTAPAKASTAQKPAAKPALPSLSKANENVRKFNTKASEAVESVKKGIEKGVASATAATASSSTSSGSNTKTSLPFSKTDRLDASPVSKPVTNPDDDSATKSPNDASTITPPTLFSGRNTNTNTIKSRLDNHTAFVPRPIFATA